MRVAISEAGVQHLRQLSQDLIKANSEIEKSGDELIRTIQSISTDLGIFGEDILSIAQHMKAIENSSRDDVELLAKAIVNKSNSLEQLVRRIKG